MPPGERRKSTSMALLRRAGTEPIMSLVKVGSSAHMASAMTRAILKNIHLAIVSRKDENLEVNATENSYAPEQRDGAEPVLKYVRVAVKPDDKPAPGASAWSESGFNYEATSKKWEGGLNAQTQKSRRSKKPAFMLREIPYDEWRKHYAKDKYGRFRGTGAPAENCILVPEDEVKYRSGAGLIEAGPSTSSEDAEKSVIVEEEDEKQQLKRSATLPAEPDIDPILSPLEKKAPEIDGETEVEEAIFIEEDGHTESRFIEAPPADLASPTSPTSPSSPILLGPPMSPIK